MINDLNSFTSLHNAEAHKERLDKHSFLQKLPWRERERERERESKVGTNLKSGIHLDLGMDTNYYDTAAFVPV